MDEALRKGIPGEHEPIGQRARAYSFATAGWLQRAWASGRRDDSDPRAVLAHHCAMIPPKVYRALNVDHGGSAKMALVSIDRSRVAWVTAALRGLALTTEVQPFLSDLNALADELAKLAE